MSWLSDSVFDVTLIGLVALLAIIEVAGAEVVGELLAARSPLLLSISFVDSPVVSSALKPNKFVNTDP